MSMRKAYAPDTDWGKASVQALSDRIGHQQTSHELDPNGTKQMQGCSPDVAG